MGTMNKLRENTGVILWILVFSFGVIWVLQDSGGLDTIGRQTQNVAVVEGEPISYEEYQNALQQRQQQVRAQTGGEIPPRMRDMIREQTFEALVNNQLLQQEMDRLGITVTDQEVTNMVFGPNPDPYIRQQFADSTGRVNRQLINNLAQNPNTKQQWIQLEDYLRNKRRSQKINSLIGATVRVSEEEILNTYRQRNTTANVRYVAQRYASVPDDSIQVTEEDLQAYYDNHQEDFEQKRTYTLNYVALSKQASAEDTSAVLGDLKALRGEFAAADNDSIFLAENASQREYTSAYFTADELEAPVADAVFPNPEPGTIVGPVVANQNAHLIKVVATRPAENMVVHARHILFRTSGEDADARQQALKVKEQLQSGANFAEMARQHSDDTGSASKGGDLGWFTRGRMAPPFEEAAFNADVGEIVGPVKTQFGYHLIKVVARAEEQVKLADLAYSLRPSNATLSDIEYKLEDLAYYAEENGNFKQEAKRQNLNVQQVEVEADQQTIPGLGQSSNIQTFLEGAEEGAISDVIELNDKFATLQVSNIQPEGYRPFEEVKAEIRPRVKVQKKRAVISRRMEQALKQNDLEGLADALGTTVRTKEGVTFDTEVVTGVGRDPAFAGTVFGLDESETSDVVEGENAAFVIHVTNMTEPDPITESQREKIRQELLRQRRQQVSNQWIASLREKAEIQDNRSQFRR